jgi:hypothetical protein
MITLTRVKVSMATVRPLARAAVAVRLVTLPSTFYAQLNNTHSADAERNVMYTTPQDGVTYHVDSFILSHRLSFNERNLTVHISWL